MFFMEAADAVEPILGAIEVKSTIYKGKGGGGNSLLIIKNKSMPFKAHMEGVSELSSGPSHGDYTVVMGLEWGKNTCSQQLFILVTHPSLSRSVACERAWQPAVFVNQVRS